jgi:hypothetical protein
MTTEKKPDVKNDNFRIKKKQPDVNFPSFKMLNPLSILFQSREARALGGVGFNLKF